jgi:hypothetical protein
MVLAPPRTLRKRERTRGELVAAAERLVAARGLDALSIDEITEEADVAKTRTTSPPPSPGPSASTLKERSPQRTKA